MEKRLALSRGPFFNPSIYQIEKIVTLLIIDITTKLKGLESVHDFPNESALIESYEWVDKLQFDDTVYALRKLQTEINHELAISGGLDLLENGNYSTVRYRNGHIFIT